MAFEKIARVTDEILPRRELYSEGQIREQCIFISEGVVSKFKVERGGSRKICSIHFPGEYIDIGLMVNPRSDYGVLVNAHCSLVSFDRGDLLSLMEASPVWAMFFMGEMAREAAIAREWSLNVGRRSGAERVGHFLLETAIRSNAGVLAKQMNFVMPFSQNDLADAMGLSLVHTNRSLQLLRSKNFIKTYGRKFYIIDRESMAEYCGFNHEYLI